VIRPRSECGLPVPPRDGAQACPGSRGFIARLAKPWTGRAPALRSEGKQQERSFSTHRLAYSIPFVVFVAGAGNAARALAVFRTSSRRIGKRCGPHGSIL
jgi:hypothetical protein